MTYYGTKCTVYHFGVRIREVEILHKTIDAQIDKLDRLRSEYPEDDGYDVVIQYVKKYSS